MDPFDTSLATNIQLAVAPVFLLAGIAGFLNVLSIRLGRIVDRARIIETRVANFEESPRRKVALRELHILWRRVRIINWSVGLCTTSALTICLVVVGIFVGGTWGLQLQHAISSLFVITMLLLIAALLLFLKEVQLATRVLQRGQEV
jgi:hypothetical protein